MTRLTASKLRENIYRILDDVVKTGRPVAVERKGVVLTINPPRIKSRLDSLIKRDILKGDPQAIVHCEWNKSWKPKFF